MDRHLRAAVLAAVAIAALAFSGGALAVYNSAQLRIESAAVNVGGGGPLILTVSTGQSDDATARLTLYAPRGYRVTLGQNAGVVLGRVNATAIAPAQTGARVPLSGTVVVDDPARHTNNTCAPGNHQGVWLLRLTGGGQTMTIPAYVDETLAPEDAYSSSKIVICLAAPTQAALGAKLIRLSMQLRGVYSNPVVRGTFTWRAVLTPYLTNAGPVNEAGTVETRSVVRLPGQLSMRALVNQRTGHVTVRGSLTAAGAAIPNQLVRVLRGTTPRGVRTYKVVRTNARGNYSTTFRMQRGWTRYLRAYVTIPARVNTAQGCAGASIAPGGCKSSTLMGFDLYSPRVLRLTRVR